MKIEKSELWPFLLNCCICFFGAAGTIFYEFSGYYILLIEMFAVFLLVLGWYSSVSFRIAPKIMFVSLLLSFFMLYNNAFWGDINSIPYILLNVMGVNFIWISIFQKSTWMIKYLSISRFIYLIYGAYTVLMFFIPALLDVSIAMFPDGEENLRNAYNSGCMPGFTNHYSTNGMLLVCGLLICGSFFIAQKNKAKNLVLFIFIVVAILFTGKRAHTLFGLMSVYGGYYVYMSDMKKSRFLNSIGILGIALIVFVMIVNYVPSLGMVFTRFVESAEAGDVTLGRIEMWNTAWEYFRMHPAIGIGWEQLKQQGIVQWNVHNIYIQLLAETGIIGFVSFVSSFSYMLTQSIRFLSQLKKTHASDNQCQTMVFSISMQIFFLLYGFTGNPIYDKEMYFPYYIACAMYICNRYCKRDGKYAVKEDGK